jgi:hypothetical protein
MNSDSESGPGPAVTSTQFENAPNLAAMVGNSDSLYDAESLWQV